MDLATLNLAAGNYFVVAKAQFELANDQTTALVECTLEAGGGVVDESAVQLGSPDTDTLPLSAAADLTAGGGSVVLNCQGTQVLASRVKLTAVQIENLSFQP